MKNINDILAHKKYHTPRWNGLLSNLAAEEKFLVMLAPAMEYVLSELKTFILHHLKSFPSLTHKDFLFNQVKDDLSSALKRKIARVCVLEMHILRVNKQLAGETAEARFENFIQRLTEPTYATTLLEKYPILKQQIEIVIDQYLQVQIELLTRFIQDFELLYQRFLDNNYSFLLSKITSSGDKHCGGRSVMILEFSHENQHKKIIYKPRSLAIDLAFQHLVSWFNQYLPDTQLFQPQIIEREQYGWYEYISYHACQNIVEVEHYYRRMGHLLMLVHLLNGSDLHSENIIAHGQFPVIIDYECFIRPFVSLMPVKNPFDLTPSRHFVTETCFLPKKFLANKQFRGIDVSALAGEGGEEAPYHAMEWENSGTDEMRLVRIKKTILSSNNIPFIADDEKINPENYQDSFISGFIQAYHIILEHKSFLMHDDSPLQNFNNVEVRVVLRNTSEYAKLMLESYHPLLLQSPEKHAAHFQWLSQIKYDPTVLKILLTAELQDIADGNIPAFYIKTNEKVLLDSHKNKLALLVILSGWENLHWNINHLSEADLIIQTTLIKNSFTAQSLSKRKTEAPVVLSDNEKRNLQKPVTETELFSLARHELDALAALKITNQGRIFWPIVEKYPDDTWHASFTGSDLYKGIAGISLAFAYGGAILQNTTYTAIAHHSIDTLLMLHAHSTSDDFENIGVFSGLSGYIYTYYKTYQLWNNNLLLDEALKLCQHIPVLLNKDNTHDIISGAAGCLVVLLKMQQEIGDKTLIPYIHLCASHILKSYPSPSEPAEDSQKPRLLGFSHGTAGVAWALAQYNSHYPSTPVKKWIQEALTYERSHYSAKENNWPNFTPDIPTYMKAWCHGSPGIGLARVDMLQYYQDNDIEKEISHSVNSLLDSPLSPYHNLCHGNLGNVELLLQQTIRAKLPQDKYDSYVRAITNSIQKNGAVCNKPPSYATPSLMLGTAGVAYQLLRLAKPTEVPAILLLK